MIGVALMVYSYIHASRGGDAYIQTTKFDPKEVRRTMFSALPGLGLPIIIIGGIISGIFSATGSSGCGGCLWLPGRYVYLQRNYIERFTSIFLLSPRRQRLAS